MTGNLLLGCTILRFFAELISLGALATVCVFPTSKHAYVDGINRKVVRALPSLGGQSYGQDGRDFVLQNV